MEFFLLILFFSSDVQATGSNQKARELAGVPAILTFAASACEQPSTIAHFQSEPFQSVLDGGGAGQDELSARKVRKSSSLAEAPVAEHTHARDEGQVGCQRRGLSSV